MGPCLSLTWAGPQVQPPRGWLGGFSPLLHMGLTASGLGLGGAEDSVGHGCCRDPGPMRGPPPPLPYPLPDTWPRRAPSLGSAIPEALGADARVAIDRIHALGPVAAPVGHAVIDVHLAELPVVAGETLAPGTPRARLFHTASAHGRRDNPPCGCGQSGHPLPGHPPPQHMGITGQTRRATEAGDPVPRERASSVGLSYTSSGKGDTVRGE